MSIQESLPELSRKELFLEVAEIPPRSPELDRPGLSYESGRDENNQPIISVINQLVGFDGATYSLDRAIQKGWLKEKEIPKQETSLEGFARGNLHQSSVPETPRERRPKRIDLTKRCNYEHPRSAGTRGMSNPMRFFRRQKS